MTRTPTPEKADARKAAKSYFGIDLTFRPRSYFWPLGLDNHLLARVKGTERKAALRALIDTGRLNEIPDFFSRSALSDEDRAALGRIHPAFMGGEYLPDLLPQEVMIARITIASTTQDTTCVCARPQKHRIQYRVADEYLGDTLSNRTTRSSTRPLSLGQLEAFFNGASPIFHVYWLNYQDMVRHLARRDPTSFGGTDADTRCSEEGRGTPDDLPYAMPGVADQVFVLGRTGAA